jgi:hypothetical protein
MLIVLMRMLVIIAYSPLVSVLGTLAGGLIGYFAAGRGERATVREQKRRRQLEFQAALLALLIEMLMGAELALSGSGMVTTWPDPYGQTSTELERIAEALESKIPFSSAKYFGTGFGQSMRTSSSKT